MITGSFPLTAGIGSGIAASVIHERSGIEHCLIGKESDETFPFNEQCLCFKKTDFYFKYHPKLCKKKSSNYGSLQFQAWVCTIFHGRNIYDFQRSKPFSKLHLVYLYPLSKQSFPNYSQNTRRSSLRISRSWNNCILLWIAKSRYTTKSLISGKNFRILWNWWIQCHPQILNIDFGLV